MDTETMPISDIQEFLPPHVAKMAFSFLDRSFPNASREVIESRFRSYCDRYLSRRFGSTKKPAAGRSNEAKPAIDALRLRVSELQSELTKLSATYREWREWKKTQPSAAKTVLTICQLATIAGEPGLASVYLSEGKSETEVMALLERRQQCRLRGEIQSPSRWTAAGRFSR